MARISISDLPGKQQVSPADLRQIVGGTGGTGIPMSASRSMWEMQMSFGLQYLTLQGKTSHENRRFTMVSNIMKTKHDTAKNLINNVR